MVNRRSRRMVDAPAQRRIVLGIAALPLSVLTAAAFVMYLLASRLFDEAQTADVELPSLGLLVIAQFVFIVTTGAFILIQAARHSHKVAGPAHRIVRSLARIRGGDTDFRVDLRRGDELVGVVDELNRVLEWLREHPPPGDAVGEHEHDADNDHSLVSSGSSGDGKHD